MIIDIFCTPSKQQIDDEEYGHVRKFFSLAKHNNWRRKFESHVDHNHLATRHEGTDTDNSKLTTNIKERT